MNNQFRFSPVVGEDNLKNVFEYIANELQALSQKIFNEKLPITTLKTFAHYQDEYKLLHKIVANIGKPAPFNSATSFYAEYNEQIAGNNIKYVGVRVVDEERPQVGCGDYEIDNFEEFKKKYVGKSKFVRDFRKDMLEVWHPDFDVLGYIIPKN